MTDRPHRPASFVEDGAGFRLMLYPPRVRRVWPVLLIGLGIALGVSGVVVGFGALDAGWIHQLPKIGEMPLPMVMPFVGAMLMVAGALWYGLIRDDVGRTHIEVRPGRILVDGEAMPLDAATHFHGGKEHLTLLRDDQRIDIHTSASSDLGWLRGELQRRTKDAGTVDDVPEALRKVAAQKQPQ